MASYAFYKKIDGASILDGDLISDKFEVGTRKTFGVKWFYGNPVSCSPGCCCLWTVPTNVTNLFIEVWGSGGSGSGACSCNRCHHYKGAGGGQYNSKMISTVPGCQYTICAAGNGNCCRRECVGCCGCTSYVNGYNLSNFCARGGSPACANTSWTTGCYSAWDCCVQGAYNNGDFGYQNHSGNFDAADRRWCCNCFCNCGLRQSQPTSAPLIGTTVQQGINYCWIRCGCWTVPFGHGGQSAMTSYCGRCCGSGGMGGPGLVRITYF